MTDRVSPTDSLVTGAAAGAARSAAGAEASRQNTAAQEAVSGQESKAAGTRAAAETEKLSGEDTAAVLKELNRLLEIYDLKARYYVDELTDRKVVQIRDAGSDRLIRQVPSQEFLDHARTLHELMGLLFDEKI